MAAQQITVESAGHEDVGEIWTLLRAAFVDEAQAYGDPFILPLTETAAQIHEQLDGGALVLKAVRAGRIVGTVRGRGEGPTYLVARLAVAPDVRRQGVARLLMTELERRVGRHHRQARSLALFTGEHSSGNLRLYSALGYREVARERASQHVTLVQLRKPLATAGEG